MENPWLTDILQIDYHLKFPNAPWAIAKGKVKDSSDIRHQSSSVSDVSFAIAMLSFIVNNTK